MLAASTRAQYRRRRRVLVNLEPLPRRDIGRLGVDVSPTIRSSTDVWENSSGNCTMASALDVSKLTLIVAETCRLTVRHGHEQAGRSRWDPVQDQDVLPDSRGIRVGGGEDDSHEGEREGYDGERNPVRFLERRHWNTLPFEVFGSYPSVRPVALADFQQQFEDMLRPLAMNPMREVVSSTRSFVIAA